MSQKNKSSDKIVIIVIIIIILIIIFKYQKPGIPEPASRGISADSSIISIDRSDQRMSLLGRAMSSDGDGQYQCGSGTTNQFCVGSYSECQQICCNKGFTQDCPGAVSCGGGRTCRPPNTVCVNDGLNCCPPSFPHWYDGLCNSVPKPISYGNFIPWNWPETSTSWNGGDWNNVFTTSVADGKGMNGRTWIKFSVEANTDYCIKEHGLFTTLRTPFFKTPTEDASPDVAFYFPPLGNYRISFEQSDDEIKCFETGSYTDMGIFLEGQGDYFTIFKRPAGFCIIDTECASTQKCKDNACVEKGCAVNDPPCDSNNDCVNNVCVLKPGCNYNNPSCLTDQDCTNNTCVKKQGCQYNNPDCTNDKNCINNTCIDKLKQNGLDCLVGSECIGGHCNFGKCSSENNQCIIGCSIGAGKACFWSESTVSLRATDCPPESPTCFSNGVNDTCILLPPIPRECTTHTIQKCDDGTEVITQYCNNGKLLTSGYKCSIPVPPINQCTLKEYSVEPKCDASTWKDYPECEWDNSVCKSSVNYQLITIIAVIFIALLVFAFIRKRKKK